MANCMSKPGQLATMAACGFDVPHTLLTTRLAQTRRMPSGPITGRSSTSRQAVRTASSAGCRRSIARVSPTWATARRNSRNGTDDRVSSVRTCSAAVSSPRRTTTDIRPPASAPPKAFRRSYRTRSPGSAAPSRPRWDFRWPGAIYAALLTSAGTASRSTRRRHSHTATAIQRSRLRLLWHAFSSAPIACVCQPLQTSEVMRPVLCGLRSTNFLSTRCGTFAFGASIERAGRQFWVGSVSPRPSNAVVGRRTQRALGCPLLDDW